MGAMPDASTFDSLFASYFFWKAVALCVVVAVVSFLYAFFTGRNIADDINGPPPSAEAGPSDTAADRQRLEGP